MGVGFYKKYFSNHHLTMWGPNTTYNFVQNTTPLNHAEKLLAVRATFDLWEVTITAKNYFDES